MSISVTCECGQAFETSEANVGARVRCPDCGRELTVPKPAPPPELLYLPELPESTATSGKAIASLALGVLFFFACLSGVPAIMLGRKALLDIKLSGGRLGGSGMAVAGIIFGLIGCLLTLGLFLPAVRSPREAAQRAQCTNYLKQIGLAMHHYHDTYGSLPTAAITDKNGRALLSWRVTILPYLESGDLYAKFHLDEPWDSLHNRSLIGAMPSVYACPSDRTAKPGMTGYQVVIGADTAFTSDFRSLQFKDFSDGLSDTIVVLEAKPGVPWTKPEDLQFGMGLPLVGLGNPDGFHVNGYNALFADGSVRFLKYSIDPMVFHALLTRNGNEVISFDQY